MRIIAGRLKGRRLAAAPGTRPTGDRVREALFSILGGRLEGTFVDLHAGAGGVGLEAFSRGARAVLVERDAKVAEVLRRNVETTGADVAVVEADALRIVKDPARAPGQPFGREPGPVEWIFSDPPYDYGPYDKLLRTLARSALVGPETVVVVEHRRGPTPGRDAMDLFRQETYGETTLSFFRRSTRASAPESASSAS